MLTDWPLFATGPRDSIFALGVICMKFVELELIFQFVFDAFFSVLTRTAVAGPTVHAWKQPLATPQTRNSTRCSHLRWLLPICRRAYRKFLRPQAAFCANVSTILEAGGQSCLPSKFATTS